MWLIGLLPMRRGRLLFPKFAFALTVTLLAGGTVMLLSTQVGETSTNLLIVNMISIAAVCLALCGLSVGLGARLPSIGDRNPPSAVLEAP